MLAGLWRLCTTLPITVTEIGAPAHQDGGSLVVRNRSRHPRTATSPLVCGLVVTTLGRVDRRTPPSTTGACKGYASASLAGTKLEFVTSDLRYSHPWKFKGRFCHFAGELCVTQACCPLRPCVDPRSAHPDNTERRLWSTPVVCRDRLPRLYHTRAAPGTARVGHTHSLRISMARPQCRGGAPRAPGTRACL